MMPRCCSLACFLMLCLMLCLMPVAAALATVPYVTQPGWTSWESNDYGTGCFLDDVNGDGLLDLAVSNGNDMAEARNYVYLNEVGSLPDRASWSSMDRLYSGHCELADIDSDGYPELMVSNYIAADWAPGRVQIYDNIAGELETTPSWVTQDNFYCFRASFGDPDGDGDLDLACATGESYESIFEPNYIFFNIDGVLQTTPGWISADTDASYDTQFVDIDGDGDQDLAMLNSGGPIKIYYNEGGTIATSPGWQTAASDDGNTFDFGDLNGDGFPDLGVAMNNQLSGTGYFQIYFSRAGVLPVVPDWQSSTTGYGSAAVFEDIDGDGDLDFVAGRWWGELHIYLNDGGHFTSYPNWTSDVAYNSVIENIVFGDLDNGASVPVVRTFPGDGRQMFYLSHRHLQGIDAITADGMDLPSSAYCYHLENGWVSLAAAPTTSVTVTFNYSRAKDMLVSNWDTSTYGFFHDGITGVPLDPSAAGAGIACRAWPNPSYGRTTFNFNLPGTSPVRLEIFDLRGRRVQDISLGIRPVGEQEVAWQAKDLAQGVYVYRLSTAWGQSTGKLQLLR